MFRIIKIMAILILLTVHINVCEARSVSLNGEWQVWFDSTVHWQQEKLILEPTDLTQIPQYPPTIGWEEMLKQGEPITVPSTWEEKYPDYDGVAWYWRELEIPSEYRGKIVRIKFWAVRHRAEVYLNQKLVGYNLEGSTPFEVDISDAVEYGQKNLLVVRVTDPGGGNNWRDYNPIPFGDVNLPDSHNFGGIWQNVELLIANLLYIEDVYVQPQEDLKTFYVQTTLNNKGTNQDIELIFQVTPHSKYANEKLIVEDEQRITCAAHKQTVIENRLTILNPKLWNPDQPFRYNLNVVVKSSNKIIDTYAVPFGMRFFTEKNGDLYFNGKRIFLKSTISWGYYPKTIAYPSRALAEKEIKIAKSFGFNAFSAHRTCATPILLEMADSLGLMIYQEPGGAPRRGNQPPKDSADVFERELFLQKFQRLVRRDRNHPSLIWWNCANERSVDPLNISLYIDRMMKMVHKEDPSRLLTYTSESGLIPMFRPFEDDYSYLQDVHTVLNKPIVWRDRLYLEHIKFFPTSPNMILFNGESRCFTGLSDLPRVVENYAPIIAKSDGAAVKDWLERLNQNFDQLGLTEDFQYLGNFCRLTGIVQGTGFARLAEAMRLNPQIDGFALNGWHCHHILGTSGMVDMFRNPKFPPEILAQKLKPLHLAISLLPSVAYSDEKVLIRVALINENNLSGVYTLEMLITDPDEKTIFKDKNNIFIKGNRETFVQTLIEYHKSFNGKSGYYHIQTKLKKKKQIILGEERAIFVQNKKDLTLPERNIYYKDEENLIPHYLDKRCNFWFENKNKFSHFYNENIIFLYNRYTGNDLSNVLEKVRQGKANLIWLERDMEEANHMLNILTVQKLLPENAKTMPYPTKAWLGGWEFCKKHLIFDGLPNPAILNWEYGEVFAPWGIQNFNEETIAGLYAVPPPNNTTVGNDKIIVAPPTMATTLGVIPCGKGKIVFCSWNLTLLLGRNPVADRIFTQIIKFAAK